LGGTDFKGGEVINQSKAKTRGSIGLKRYLTTQGRKKQNDYRGREGRGYMGLTKKDGEDDYTLET